MRILVNTFPAYGHLHPLLPLALAAQAAGHEVCVATGPDLITWVRRCGLRAHTVGLAQADALRLAEQHHPGPQASDHLFADVWVRAALPDLRRLAATWCYMRRKSTPARCSPRSWACAASRTRGPRRLAPRTRRTAERLLAAVWDDLLPGVAPRTTGELYLDACPAALQTEALALVPHIVPVRAVLFDGPSSTPPAWLATLAHPAAYLTLGTVPVFSTPQLLGALVAAVSPLLAGLVVTTGPNPVAALGPLPAHVHAVSYVPQSQVLSHVDLVISHGGAGGTVGALLAGLPHLVLPQGGQSQETAAERVQAWGLGLRLGPGEWTPEALRVAVERLLSESGYRQRAVEVRAEVENRPGPAEVVRLLEEAPTPLSGPTRSKRAWPPGVVAE